MRYYAYKYNSVDPGIVILVGDGCSGGLVQNAVTVCPGINYELTFTVGTLSYFTLPGTTPPVTYLNAGTCSITWYTGPPSSASNVEHYQSSPTYTLPSSETFYRSFGPWTFHSAMEDPGVTHKSGDLFINLTAIIYCQGASNGFIPFRRSLFFLSDVQLNAVG